MTLLTSRASPGLPYLRPASMFSLPRTATLLAICALVAAAIVPSAALAQGGKSPAGENYVLDVPDAGNGGGQGGQGSGGSDDGSSVPAAAAEGTDDGGLPILLIVLAGAALVGAGIAIARRRPTS